MEKSKSDALFMQYQDIVPQEQKFNLKRSLEKASDDSYDNLIIVKTYNPMIVLICSIFLGVFGVDRFIIGDIELGICKLLFGVFTFGIWPLVDIFFCYKKAKEKNLNNILSALN